MSIKGLDRWLTTQPESPEFWIELTGDAECNQCGRMMRDGATVLMDEHDNLWCSDQCLTNWQEARDDDEL